MSKETFFYNLDGNYHPSVATRISAVHLALDDTKDPSPAWCDGNKMLVTDFPATRENIFAERMKVCARCDKEAKRREDMGRKQLNIAKGRTVRVTRALHPVWVYNGGTWHLDHSEIIAVGTLFTVARSVGAGRGNGGRPSLWVLEKEIGGGRAKTLIGVEEKDLELVAP